MLASAAAMRSGAFGPAYIALCRGAADNRRATGPRWPNRGYRHTQGRDRHSVANDELAPAYMILHHGYHIREILAGQGDLGSKAQVFWIQRSVTQDAPQRLLHLRGREQKPTVDLSSLAAKPGARIDRVGANSYSRKCFSV